MCTSLWTLVFFFFNDTATTEIYPLSLHDALPILALGEHRLLDRPKGRELGRVPNLRSRRQGAVVRDTAELAARSEEHTSELQSRPHLRCRLLLEKKKNSRLIRYPSIS